jgi:hypothetical protein
MAETENWYQVSGFLCRSFEYNLYILLTLFTYQPPKCQKYHCPMQQNTSPHRAAAPAHTR